MVLLPFNPRQMKFIKYFLAAALLSLAMYSCKKDDPIMCESDPRLPAVGTYTMLDSVFFLGAFTDTISYPMNIVLDSLEGDSILLENMFGPVFTVDIKAEYDPASGDFIMVPTQDTDAVVSGSGNISGNQISYSALYSDGGYSFRGTGSKE